MGARSLSQSAHFTVSGAIWRPGRVVLETSIRKGLELKTLETTTTGSELCHKTWYMFQLKGSQEPKAKKSRRSQMVEPKEEASVSETFPCVDSTCRTFTSSTLLLSVRTRSQRWRR